MSYVVVQGSIYLSEESASRLWHTQRDRSVPPNSPSLLTWISLRIVSASQTVERDEGWIFPHLE